jgi:hypothetical protein
VFLSMVPMLVLATGTLVEGHEPDARSCRAYGAQLPAYERERAMPHPMQRLAPRRSDRNA